MRRDSSSQILSQAMVCCGERPSGGPVRAVSQPSSAVAAWIDEAKLTGTSCFPVGFMRCPHLSTRQYARIVEHWVESAGLAPSAMRPFHAEATLIYKRTKNLRAVQLLLRHSIWKARSAISALVDDAPGETD